MSGKYAGPPPPYSSATTPPAAPPTYEQAVGGVPPVSPYIQHHTVIKGPEILTTVVPVGSDATHMICPHCRAEIDTTTRSKPGSIAYIAGILICLMGCPLGCCLIPCFIDKCMDVHHTCPNCKSYLGKFSK